jgi:CheY-like chemotaxis protein/Tfp pilus assembly protein PilZ
MTEEQDAGVRAHLRAKLEHRGRVIEAYSLHITETLVVVQTSEHASVGDEVFLTLSFPGIIDDFRLRTQVVSLRLSSGPGEGGGWSLGFVFASDEEARTLSDLLHRLSAPQEEPAKVLRILLVEDSRLVQDVFRYSLKRFFRGRNEPLEIEVADSGEQAVALLAAKHFDMAIVDYFLPDRRGDQVIHDMKAMPEARDLTVVAISVGGEEARAATMKAGADLFLDKPIVMDDLFGTLEQVSTSRGARP